MFFRSRIGRPTIISPVELDAIENARAAGMSLANIALCYGRTPSSLSQALYYRRRTRGIPKKESTRPRRLSGRLVRRIVLAYRKGEVLTLKEGVEYLKKFHDTDISTVSLRETLLRNKMRCRCKALKTSLSRNDKKRRLTWAIAHKDWSVESWRKVIFSDETIFKAFEAARSSLRQWIHEEDEKFLNLISLVTKRRDLRVAAWGCVTSQGASQLAPIEGSLTSSKFIDILAVSLKEVVERYDLDPSEVILQMDNAPVHTSRATKEFLKKQGYSLLDWPPYSPDLNIIENIWARTQQEVLKRNTEISSKAELIDVAKRAFEGHSAELLESYYDSMPRRVQAVIDSKGDVTKY